MRQNLSDIPLVANILKEDPTRIRDWCFVNGVSVAKWHLENNLDADVLIDFVRRLDLLYHTMLYAFGSPALNTRGHHVVLSCLWLDVMCFQIKSDGSLRRQVADFILGLSTLPANVREKIAIIHLPLER